MQLCTNPVVQTTSPSLMSAMASSAEMTLFFIGVAFPCSVPSSVAASALVSRVCPVRTTVCEAIVVRLYEEEPSFRAGAPQGRTRVA